MFAALLPTYGLSRLFDNEQINFWANSIPPFRRSHLSSAEHAEFLFYRIPSFILILSIPGLFKFYTKIFLFFEIFNSLRSSFSDASEVEYCI